MKINKLLLLTLVSCFALSCSQDTFEDQIIEEPNDRNALGQYDESYLGVYKGLFTTNDGLTRGSVILSLLNNNEPSADLKLSSGEVIELKSSEGKLVGDYHFATDGTGPINASFDFLVNEDGTSPSISNVVFDSKSSNILIAKELARAPLNTITGTYMRTSGSGGFPTSGRTWNIMSIGAGDQTYGTQIFYGGNIYNTMPTGTQSNCVVSGDFATCDIDGFTTILGHDVTWTGTHTYDIFDDNLGCSEVSGTWAAPTYGNSAGTFVSDSDCDSIDVVNDVCENATAISLDDSLVGTTAGSTTTGSPGEGECDDDLFFNAATIENGVWYVYTATANIDVQIDTEGTLDLPLDPDDILDDTQLRVFSGTCGALVCVDNDDDDGESLLSSLSFSATSGESYYIYVGGYSDGEGVFLLNISEFVPPIPFDLDLTCGEFMVDNGLEAANYADDSFDTYSIDAGAGGTISLEFSQFNVENTWDSNYNKS